MNYLLAITKEDYSTPIINTKGFGETFLFGLEIVGIGMLTVFSVLILLWIALSIFKTVFAADKSSSNVPVQEVVSSPVSAPVKASADEEIVAVIAAAIAMAESENTGLKFRVVSFKRK